MSTMNALVERLQHTWRRGAVVAVALLTLVAVAGCAAQTPTEGTLTERNAASAPAETEDPVSSITAEEAAEVALRAVPEGTVLEIGPGSEERQAVWEVLVRKPDGSAVEAYVLSSTGEILKQEPTTVPAEISGITPAVTMQQASATALAAVPGGRLVEIDLDTEYGRTVWEALVAGSDGHIEIYIDATTGNIVKQERAE